MSKLRTDSWAANLTEEQAWALYYKARGLRWNEAADWAVKEFGVDAPSRTAFYAWLGHMRAEESAHRLEQAATLLRQGIRITEAAERVGFTSSSYFARCFKNRFGVLPKDFVSR